jgi:glycosyltransferase involved in cell wall biosynthesis
MVRTLIIGDGWFPDAPGGLNRYVRELKLALSEAGRNTSAIVIGPASDPPSELRVVETSRSSLLERVTGVARAARLEAGGIDVVDAHFALYAAVPCLAASLRSKPLVVHFHGPWADESGAAGDHPAAVWGKRSIERLVYRRAREVVTLSAAFRRLVVERYGVDPWRVSVVPPGVDTDRFFPGDGEAARASLGVAAGAQVAVCPRRLVPRMGIDRLLLAWASLGRLPDRVLLLVGEGPQRGELERLSVRLGLSATVRFLGKVPENVLLDCYRAADVCVVPSLALEGFGLVVLEALACGTPVIVTDAGGLPETVAGLDASLVVPAGSAPRLAERMRTALEDGALPERERCRSYVSGFTWQRAVVAHVGIYTRALDRRRVSHDPRIVYVDHCARLSGGELALIRLLRAIEGVEAHVILGEDGPLVDLLLRSGISVEVLPMPAAASSVRRGHVLPGSLPAASVAASAAYATRLARRLRRLRPDLIHSNSLKAALVGGVAAKAAGRPIVWHVRDRIAGDYLPPAAVRLVRGVAQHVPHAVIANSRATLATLPGLHCPSKVLFDPVEPMTTPAVRGRNGLRIGMVGRIAPWKGQHIFVDAFARAFPDGAEEAVIIGSPLFGEEAYGAGLRDLAAARGVAERLRFAGFREDVPAELAGLDVLVHASVLPEPFGQVVAEGMTAGLPVVAAAAGGPAELIRDGVDGMLFPPADAAALAACLRRLAADSTLRRSLGQTARATSFRFEPETIAAEVMRVYRGVLSGRGSR